MKFKPKFAAKHVGRVVSVQSPQILTAIGVVGVAGTAFLAARAAFTAGRSVQGYENIQSPEDAAFELDKLEVAKVVWKDFVPAVVVGGATIGCIIAANRIQARRLAALAAAYAVLSGDFDEYRDKVLEKAGVKKAKEVDDEIATEKVLKNPPPTAAAYPVLDGTKSWFQDLSTGQNFLSDRQEVESARNALNRYLLDNGYADLNEWYKFLGLESTNLGSQLGWKEQEQIEVVYSAVLLPDGSAATALTLHPGPTADFDSFH